jgi:ubiquinone/menaquinone biosynthesis C-methylase UbiE
MSDHPSLDPEIAAYYDVSQEQDRLSNRNDWLEFMRSCDLLSRSLPPAPAAVLDVGGGPGAYASWLARRGYRVHLIDPVPLHVDQARATAAARPDHPFTAAVGDARELVESDGSFDAVLLFGPLYHLTERADRLQALREARRVLRLGGVALAVGISRFASLLDGLRQGFLADPVGKAMVEQDLRDGQHRNPDGRLGWFTTAYFHHPDELAAEVVEAGFALDGVLGIEGPGGLLASLWDDPVQRPMVIEAARLVEREPSLLGLSFHLMAIGRVA